MLCKWSSESPIFLLNQVNRRRHMRSHIIKNIDAGREADRVPRQQNWYDFRDRKGRLACPVVREEMVDQPRSRQPALSQLDDDQLSNLSESGLRARREAGCRHKRVGQHANKRAIPSRQPVQIDKRIQSHASIIRCRADGRQYRYCMSVSQALGQQTCTPAFAFKHVRLSEMRPPTLTRKWTASPIGRRVPLCDQFRAFRDRVLAVEGKRARYRFQGTTGLAVQFCRCVGDPVG